jgi:hypothetical protein
VIDRSLSNIKSATSQTKRSAESAELNIARLEEELKHYAWIDDAEKFVAVLEKKEQRIWKIERFTEQLKEFLQQYDAALSKVKEYSYSIGLRDRITDIEAVQKSLNDKQLQIETLRRVLSRVEQTQTALGSLPVIKGAEKAILALEKAHMDVVASKRACNVFYQQISNVEHLSEKVRESLANQARAVQNYKKAMPDICPLCEQPVQDK